MPDESLSLSQKSISWLLTAFATPALLSTISKIDPRLNLLPLLERIVVGYEKFSNTAWSKIGAVLGLNFTELHGVMTLTILCIFQCLNLKKINKDNGSFSINKRRFFELFSLIFISTILISGPTVSFVLFAINFSLFSIMIFVFNNYKYGKIEAVMLSIVILIMFLLSYIFSENPERVFYT